MKAGGFTAIAPNSPCVLLEWSTFWPFYSIKTKTGWKGFWPEISTWARSGILAEQTHRKSRLGKVAEPTHLKNLGVKLNLPQVRMKLKKIETTTRWHISIHFPWSLVCRSPILNWFLYGLCHIFWPGKLTSMGMTFDEICLSCDWHTGGTFEIGSFTSEKWCYKKWFGCKQCSNTLVFLMRFVKLSFIIDSPCSVQSDIHEPKPWFRRSQS